MTDSHPGVEDEVERALRLGLATAAQLADRLARARQDLARQAQHRHEVEARQFEARYRAEGAAATARLSLVDRTEWWDHATTGDILGMYELATGWQHDEPCAAIALATVTREVRDRFGIDSAAPGADRTELRALLARIELDRAVAVTRDQGGARDSGAAVAAVLLATQRDADLAAPDGMQHEVVLTREALLDTRPDTSLTVAIAANVSADEAQELVHETPHDSAQRRAGTATGLREAGVAEEVIAVAMRADVAHARPAAEAATARTLPATQTRRRARVTSRSVEDRICGG